jgi:hypothetical protein
MDEKRLKTIENRLNRLEKAVFGTKGSGKSKTTVKNFSGLKGGLLFLVSRDFFKTKRLLADVTKELKNHGYHYRAGAINTTLTRLSDRKGPLAMFIESGKKVYVRRK